MNPFDEENGQEHLIMSTMPSPPPPPKPEGSRPSAFVPKVKECKEWAKFAAYSLCATLLLILVACAVIHFIVLKSSQQRK